jgi:hypothetical protein
MDPFGDHVFPGTVFTHQRIIALNRVVLRPANDCHIMVTEIGHASSENEALKTKNIWRSIRGGHRSSCAVSNPAAGMTRLNSESLFCGMKEGISAPSWLEASFQDSQIIYGGIGCRAMGHALVVPQCYSVTDHSEVTNRNIQHVC